MSRRKETQPDKVAVLGAAIQRISSITLTVQTYYFATLVN